MKFVLNVIRFMEKIILIDFSKVVSNIWISRFLSSNLEKYLTINKEQIREIYKTNIHKLVTWDYTIFQFLEELKIYIKKWYDQEIIKKTIYEIPSLDKDLLNLLLDIKNDYQVYLVSDIYKELWYELKKSLPRYFDKFIFSFEEWSKKSEKIFWEKIRKKVDFKNCILYIDDKKENILMAELYWIKWLIYKNFKDSNFEILSILYTKNMNI